VVNLTRNQNLTTQPVQAGDCSHLSPEFGRVPDVQRLFGIKRGILYRWISEKRVKTFLIREPGNQQGIRIIYLQSVRAYLMSQMEIQERETQEEVLST
jgi:hypothetical protein